MEFNNLKLLFSQVLFFLLIQLFGLVIALDFIKKEAYSSIPRLSVFWFVIAFAVMTFLLIFSLKYIKTGALFRIAFIILIFTGAYYAFSMFFSSQISFFFSAVFIVLWILIDNILIHDFAIAFAVAGVGAQLGLSLSVGSVLILFALLSLYDVLAVYKTKHMVKMFKSLSGKGVLLALIIPFKLKNFLLKTKKAKIGKDFLVLGTGDLAFPLIFAISCLRINLMTSLFVIAGAIFGLIIIFFLLLNQDERKAMPALPPIAFGSILGFVIALIFQSI